MFPPIHNALGLQASQVDESKPFIQIQEMPWGDRWEDGKLAEAIQYLRGSRALNIPPEFFFKERNAVPVDGVRMTAVKSPTVRKMCIRGKMKTNNGEAVTPVGK